MIVDVKVGSEPWLLTDRIPKSHVLAHTEELECLYFGCSSNSIDTLCQSFNCKESFRKAAVA